MLMLPKATQAGHGTSENMLTFELVSVVRWYL